MRILQVCMLAVTFSPLGTSMQQNDLLPKYTGPKPPWPYRGFDRFPALWFGTNQSGLDTAAQMDLIAKHQIGGWGWQQNFHTVSSYNGSYYQQETSLAQMASRFASYMEFGPQKPDRQIQSTFVYRHLQTAEYYWSLSAAAFHDPRNVEMFMHNERGDVCWIADNTGPLWNFSNQKAMDWYVDEIGGELTREANINAVFFDETDWLYCGPIFNNCSQNASADQYHKAITMMRRLALKLNAAGIWPIYSSFNGFSDTRYRACPFPFEEYYKALADVGWFRFYEFGIGGTMPDPSGESQGQLRQALHESALGLPVMVHAYLDQNPNPGNTPRTLPLALFLLAQNEYWYLGISSGWMDNDWQWWPEYDAHYGKPLGPAVEITNPPGWKREFEACTVFVSSNLTNASIVFHSSSPAAAAPDLLV